MDRNFHYIFWLKGKAVALREGCVDRNLLDMRYIRGLEVALREGCVDRNKK